jgi:hypothetical protein
MKETGMGGAFGTQGSSKYMVGLGQEVHGK